MSHVLYNPFRGTGLRGTSLPPRGSRIEGVDCLLFKSPAKVVLLLLAVVGTYWLDIEGRYSHLDIVDIEGRYSHLDIEAMPVQVQDIDSIDLTGSAPEVPNEAPKPRRERTCNDTIDEQSLFEAYSKEVNKEVGKMEMNFNSYGNTRGGADEQGPYRYYDM